MRRLLTYGVVVVLVLTCILGIVDRVAVHAAETEISQRVATSLASRNITSSPPEVTIVEIPFLTQVAQGNFEEIQLNVRDLRGGAIPLPLLEVHAYDVRASLQGLRNGEKAIATLITGVGTLSYADLVRATGLEGIVLVGDGTTLRITGNVPIAGLLTGTAEVIAVDGKVRLQVKDLVAENLTPAVQPLITTYAQKLAHTFTLPTLPFNMKLENVDPDPSGLRISVSAREVEL